MLELDILLSEGLNLSIGSIELDFSIFDGKLLVFELTADIEKLILSTVMGFLLFFVTVNPEVSSLFLAVDNLIEIGDSFIELLLSHIKLTLDSLFLNLDVSVLSSELLYLFLKLIDLSLSLVKSFITHGQLLDQVFIPLLLISNDDLKVMSCLVHSMQTVLDLGQLSCFLSQLLGHLVKLDLESSKLDLILVSLDLGNIQISLELLYLLLSTLVYLIKSNHFSFI